MQYAVIIDFVGVFVTACTARAWLALVLGVGGLGIWASATWPVLHTLPWPVLLVGILLAYAVALVGWFLLTEWVFDLQMRQEERRAEAARANTWPPAPRPIR